MCELLLLIGRDAYVPFSAPLFLANVKTDLWPKPAVQFGLGRNSLYQKRPSSSGVAIVGDSNLLYHVALITARQLVWKSQRLVLKPRECAGCFRARLSMICTHSTKRGVWSHRAGHRTSTD